MNTKCCAPPWQTNHFLISSLLSFTNPHLSNSSPKRNNIPNFSTADYSKISNILLNTNWDFLNSSKSFQSKYDQFCAIITSVIDDNIPLISCRQKRRKPPRHIKKLLIKKSYFTIKVKQIPLSNLPTGWPPKNMTLLSTDGTISLSQGYAIILTSGNFMVL